MSHKQLDELTDTCQEHLELDSQRAVVSSVYELRSHSGEEGLNVARIQELI